MQLEFVERRRGTRNKYEWTPFEPDPAFEAHWWDDPPYLLDDPWFIQVQREGVEVARVELENHVGFEEYVGAPYLGSVALKIQLFEVSDRCRRQGIATAAVQGLALANPSRRLVAFSEEADEFWGSLGWDRYDHLDGPTLHQPLFIATPGYPGGGQPPS